MSLVPAYFGVYFAAIGKSDASYAFPLTPSTFAVGLLQSVQLADCGPGSESLSGFDRADNVEIHDAAAPDASVAYPNTAVGPG
jgi:hypothetical protein